MTQGKRAATRKGGGSSAARNGGAPKTFKFRGVELTVPAKLPDTLSFDLGEIQMLAQADDNGVVGVIHRVLSDLLGREDLWKVRAVVKGVDDPWQNELLNKVLAAHDVEMGEASASAASL